MALLTRAGRDDTTPVATDRLEEILDRVQLVDLASLRRYECTDPRKVREIRRSLLTIGLLINPVVVDPKRRLLIDGHHRAQAFEQLGLTQIPSFTVDYLSGELVVRGWNHATEAPREDIESAIDAIDGPADGPSEVVFDDLDGHTFAHRDLPDSWESARCMARVADTLERKGFPLAHQAGEDGACPRANQGYIRPVVGREDVLEMVEQGKLFPREVNRHLIEDRPLGLQVPVSIVEDRHRFAEHLDRLRSDTRPVSAGPGSAQDGRFYGERVTLFQTSSGS